MKEVILKAFKELGPCGIRTVVNAIQEEHAEVKTLTHKLATAGLLFMQSNMQFRITDSGLAELEKLQKAPAQVPTETKPVPIPENQPAPKPVKQPVKAEKPNLSEMSTDDLIQLACETNDFLLEIRAAVRDRVAVVIGLNE